VEGSRQADTSTISVVAVMKYGWALLRRRRRDKIEGARAIAKPRTTTQEDQGLRLLLRERRAALE